MTPAEILKQTAEAEPLVVCTLYVNKKNEFMVSHSSMPMPFLCLLKENLQAHILRLIAKENIQAKSPIITPVSPLTQVKP